MLSDVAQLRRFCGGKKTYDTNGSDDLALIWHHAKFVVPHHFGIIRVFNKMRP